MVEQTKEDTPPATKMQALTRLWGWVVLAGVLAIIVAFVSPQQTPVMVYKFSMVAISAVMAYWIDHSLFKYSAQAGMAKNMERDAYSAARLIARALIYLGTVLGITLGL